MLKPSYFKSNKDPQSSRPTRAIYTMGNLANDKLMLAKRKLSRAFCCWLEEESVSKMKDKYTYVGAGVLSV